VRGVITKKHLNVLLPCGRPALLNR